MFGAKSGGKVQNCNENCAEHCAMLGEQVSCIGQLCNVGPIRYFVNIG